MAETQLLQIEVIPEVIDFVIKADKAALAAIYHISQQVRKLDDGRGAFGPVLQAQRVERVQGIEQEVRIDLLLQQVQFGLNPFVPGASLGPIGRASGRERVCQ